MHDVGVECLAALGLVQHLVVDDVDHFQEGVVSSGVAEHGIDVEVLSHEVHGLFQSLGVQLAHLARHVLQDGQEVDLVGTVVFLGLLLLVVFVHLADQVGHHSLEQQVGVATSQQGQRQDLVVTLQGGLQVVPEHFLQRQQVQTVDDQHYTHLFLRFHQMVHQGYCQLLHHGFVLHQVLHEE